MTGSFAGEHVLVIGAGVAGRSAAALYARRGATVRVTEVRSLDDLGDLTELTSAGVEIRTGGHAPEHLDGIGSVFVSPGVPPTAAPLAWARERGLEVHGELELGARVASVPYLAVTGTNGKTTSTGMLAACLRAAGHDAVACGNIGTPFPTAATEDHDVLVVECSSFQLTQQESFHPRVSVLLNFAPDHLDWHGTNQAYEAAKARVFARQEGDDVHVGNRDDAAAAAISAGARCLHTWFRSGEPGPGEVGYVGGELVARLYDEVRMGPVDASRAGFRADAAAAAAAALAFGVHGDAVAMGLAAYEPPRHRGEVVAVADGVRFLDNSKATNVHAALAALAEVEDVVLIAGGRAKGADLGPLAGRVDAIRAVVAIGEAADEVERVFRGLIDVRRAASIEEAVGMAHDLASPDGTVLLAPACASWDMFANYEERGDRFAAAARSLGAAVSNHG